MVPIGNTWEVLRVLYFESFITTSRYHERESKEAVRKKKKSNQHCKQPTVLRARPLTRFLLGLVSSRPAGCSPSISISSQCQIPMRPSPYYYPPSIMVGTVITALIVLTMLSKRKKQGKVWSGGEWGGEPQVERWPYETIPWACSSRSSDPLVQPGPFQEDRLRIAEAASGLKQELAERALRCWFPASECLEDQMLVRGPCRALGHCQRDGMIFSRPLNLKTAAPRK